MFQKSGSAIAIASHKDRAMGNSLKRIRSVGRAVGILCVGYCLLGLLVNGLASSAFARDVKVPGPGPIFDAAAAKAFPQAIFDKIEAKITFQTTFQQLGPEGIDRWWTRTIKLVDFVKSPSQTDQDTYLYAMRYVVSVLSDKDSLSVDETSCQVVVVFKDGEYDEATVVCEPVILNRHRGTL
jgi:hypothetical protein